MDQGPEISWLIVSWNGSTDVKPGFYAIDSSSKDLLVQKGSMVGSGISVVAIRI